jgi:hypothetical protein
MNSLLNGAEGCEMRWHRAGIDRMGALLTGHSDISATPLTFWILFAEAELQVLTP